jgi:hypothetical protein
MSAGHDMKNANATYDGFMTMLKVGLVAVVLITALVVKLIA